MYSFENFVIKSGKKCGNQQHSVKDEMCKRRRARSVTRRAQSVKHKEKKHAFII